ncbi:MAG: PDDEXK nuclease domain-containing protein [Saccharofermentanales bacterium]
MTELNAQEYGIFIKEIKQRVYNSQYEALKTLNRALIELYWEIGKDIYIQQKEKGWGKSIVEILSNELQNEFPDIKGFSARNLWNMRNFFGTYNQNEILQPLVAEISWTKNIIIMDKCKEDLEREFYIRMTKRYGWTKNVLINNLENKAYEKYLLNQTNFDETVPEKYRVQAKYAVKDEYTFDFLEMGLEHSERELELGLINNVRAFLSEMGGNFTFIANQYHIDLDGDDFFIDLLLFHRKLKSLIAIELKIGNFKPEYAGKMQFYLTVLDEKVKLQEENPSIGIIICKSKNRTVVEYALKSASKPIGVSTYDLSNTLPENMKNLLPTPEEITESLSILDDNKI